MGLAEPLRRALEPLGRRITVAFVYGSVAKGTDTTRSDIDLMIVSDDMAYAEVFEALQQAEAAIGRPVSPNILALEEWRTRRNERSHFASEVAAEPKLFVIGAEDGLG